MVQVMVEAVDRSIEAPAETWHHGLMARWWANFNLDGPEIEYFRSYVEAGQPALDLGCGTGRLLVPWVAGGLDVDGVDAAPDMITVCREACARAGREPRLYVQAAHQLDLPRRYSAIVNCGSFGLGGSRAQDREGLRRSLAHLRPGGVLVLDYEVKEFDADRLRRWKPKPVDESIPPPEDRRVAPDGFQYALRHRFVAIDVEDRSMRREMRLWQWRGDELVAHETHSLRYNVYSSEEIESLLAEVGFVNVNVLGGYHGGAPQPGDRFHVFRATAP